MVLHKCLELFVLIVALLLFLPMLQNDLSCGWKVIAVIVSLPTPQLIIVTVMIISVSDVIGNCNDYISNVIVTTLVYSMIKYLWLGDLSSFGVSFIWGFTIALQDGVIMLEGVFDPRHSPMDPWSGIPIYTGVIL